MVREPPRGYFLETTKSILIVSSQNIPRAETFFTGYRLYIFMGSRYLRGFVGSKVAQYCWLGDKVKYWGDSMTTLDGVVRCHPYTAYSGLQKSLQQECKFLQSITPDIGMAFQVVQDALWYIFLWALFQGAQIRALGGQSPVCRSNRPVSPSLTQLG